MACPKCGKKFFSDFKLHGETSGPPQEFRNGNEPRKNRMLRWLYNNVFCFWYK